MGSDPQQVLQRALKYLAAAHAITLAQFQDTRHPSLRTIQTFTDECMQLSESLRLFEQGAMKMQDQSKLLLQWALIPEKDADAKSSKDPLWYRNAHRIYRLQPQGSAGSGNSSCAQTPHPAGREEREEKSE